MNLRTLGRGLSMGRYLIDKGSIVRRANVAVLVETVVGGHIDHIVPADVTGLGLARCEGSCDRGS